MITTVTGKNQITIPTALVKNLDIQLWQRIDWRIGEEEGQLIAYLIPSRAELARKAAGMGREWLDEGSDHVADLITERIKDDE